MIARKGRGTMGPSRNREVGAVTKLARCMISTMMTDMLRGAGSMRLRVTGTEEVALPS